MKAFVLPSRLRIDPFGDPVSESMIGNRTLRDIQWRVLGEAGLEVEFVSGPERLPAGPYLLTWDDVYFTRRVLTSLLEQRPATGSIRCGLPASSLLVQRTAPLQDLGRAELDGEELALYRLYLVDAPTPPGSEAGLGALLETARPVRVRFREKVVDVPVPKNIVGLSAYPHPLTSSVVMHIGHWVHILWANQLSIQIRWVETILDRKAWVGGVLAAGGLSAILRGRLGLAGLKWEVAARLNRIGRDCDIHPTARVELSQLGDGVRVGANALVRGSLIGDGVQIEDRAYTVYSVVGEGCFVSKNSVLVFCAGYPQGDLCANGMQFSLFGRKVAMTSWLRVIDLKAQGEIKVMHRGELCAVGTRMLGACFGHGSFGGMDVTVQSGRAIPNGAMLVKDPDQILRKVPDDLPAGQPAWVRRGTAVTESDE